jgi:hypothetical protein
LQHNVFTAELLLQADRVGIAIGGKMWVIKARIGHPG